MENKDKIIRVRMDSSTRHKLYLIKQDKTMSEYIRDNIVKKFVVLVDNWKDDVMKWTYLKYPPLPE